MEVSFDEVWRHFTYLTFVGTVLLDPDHALEFELLHQTLYGLVVDQIAAVMQFKSYPSVSVTPLILMEYRCYLFLLGLVFIRLHGPLQVVVIGTSWYPGYLQKFV